MKISEVRRNNEKEQAALLRKIVNRRQRLAARHAEIDALHAEIADLQSELIQVTAENIAWWDGVADDNLVVVPPCSEMNIPLPTAVPEKILVNGRGVFSSTRGFVGGVDQ